jgi:hypothetical protein
MFRPAPSLLNRLRRHRGLWLLAVAVLMIKLTAGTICLGDGPNLRLASTTAAATSLYGGSLDVAEKAAPVDAKGDCLLGEPGDCHCACAHSVTLPTTALASITMMKVRFASSAIGVGYTPAMTGSLLRPPIA